MGLETFLRLSLSKKFLLVGAFMALLAGLCLRLWQVRSSGFFFYDEGFYLQHNLPVLEFVKTHALNTQQDKDQALYYYFRSALGSGKSLWFFIMDSRFLWGGIYDWAFSKAAACFFGITAMALVFAFARRLFSSVWVALMAAALYALLPAAVFYSRIGLQEALSTVLVLGGLYLYFFPRTFGWRTFAAGFILGLAFFSNYRLIMLPLLIGVYEGWATLVLRNGGGLRKFVWAVLAFFACVIIGGNLAGGVNTQVIAMWVFHQGQSAGGSFAWVNVLSYPYYIFLLETPLYAAAFLGAAWWLFRYRKNYTPLIILPLFQMFFFSFTEEKGARYIAVILPFTCMAVALLVRDLWSRLAGAMKTGLVVYLILMSGFMLYKSFSLSVAFSGHKAVGDFLRDKDPQVKFLSSQEMVDSLYFFPHTRVRAVPPGFEAMLAAYSKGYRYLVLDPQAYVSLTQQRKFTLPLKDYLGYLDSAVQPIKVFPHMNQALLERFVMEHSENLLDSAAFLARPDWAKSASIRIYDLQACVPAMLRVYESLKARGH